jgi:hypothetical protein
MDVRVNQRNPRLKLSLRLRRAGPSAVFQTFRVTSRPIFSSTSVKDKITREKQNRKETSSMKKRNILFAAILLLRTASLTADAEGQTFVEVEDKLQA